MHNIDTNILLAIIIVVSIVFITLLVFCCVTISKEWKCIPVELTSKAGVYDNLTEELLWNGKLPEKANDYTKPRYVYENLIETTVCRPENGRIIGYRISPTLVLHSRVLQIKPSLAAFYRDRFGGKLLEFSDVKTLVAVWQEVSELRIAAGDKPLNSNFLYATRRGSLVICKIDNMTWEYSANLPNHDSCLLILKR